MEMRFYQKYFKFRGAKEVFKMDGAVIMT